MGWRSWECVGRWMKFPFCLSQICADANRWVVQSRCGPRLNTSKARILVSQAPENERLVFSPDIPGMCVPLMRIEEYSFHVTFLSSGSVKALLIVRPLFLVWYPQSPFWLAPPVNDLAAHLQTQVPDAFVRLVQWTPSDSQPIRFVCL